MKKDYPQQTKDSAEEIIIPKIKKYLPSEKDKLTLEGDKSLSKVKPFSASPAAKYSVIYSLCQQICYDNGYALTIHGSMQRDVDLIAIPWTNESIAPNELILLIAEKLGGTVVRDITMKPHGRRAYNIILEHTHFIDIGVMPRAHENPECFKFDYSSDIIITPENQFK